MKTGTGSVRETLPRALIHVLWVVSGAVWISACAAPPPPTPSPTPTATPQATLTSTALPTPEVPRTAEYDETAAAEAGRVLFLNFCSLCHYRGGTDVGANDAPHLVGVTERHSEAHIIGQILGGGGRMPSYKSAIDTQTIQSTGTTQLGELLAYLRSLTEGAPEAPPLQQQPDPQAAARGAMIFQENCEICHFEGGRELGVGLGIDPPPPVLIDVTWRHGETFLRQQIQEGRGNMPPYGDRLSREEVEDLLVYLRSLRPVRE